jgi:hypothetical protein
MKVREAYPSKYLNAADIKKPIKVKIAGILMERMQDGKEKPVMTLVGSKPLILNPTNAHRLAAIWGDEMDDWIGQTVTLYTETVPFGRDMVQGIRVRVDGKFQEQRRVPTAEEVAQAAQAPLSDLGDDISDII